LRVIEPGKLTLALHTLAILSVVRLKPSRVNTNNR